MRCSIRDSNRSSNQDRREIIEQIQDDRVSSIGKGSAGINPISEIRPIARDVAKKEIEFPIENSSAGGIISIS